MCVCTSIRPGSAVYRERSTGVPSHVPMLRIRSPSTVMQESFHTFAPSQIAAKRYEVAENAGIAKRTIRSWRIAAEEPPVKDFGRRARPPYSDLDILRLP